MTRNVPLLGLLAALLCVTGYLAAQSPAPEHGQEAARQKWFYKGRTVPGQNTAAIRYRAYLHEMQMRKAPAQQPLQGHAPPPNTGGTWTSLGPAPLASDATGLGEQNYNWVSGRVTAVAIDPADSTGNTVYIGGAYGGVWTSSNAATTTPADVVWTPLTDDQATLAIGSLAIQPGNSSQTVILAGTGETDSSVDSYFGLGILRGTYVAPTWTWNLIQYDSTNLRPFAGLGFSKIAFSTTTPNIAVAAAASTSQGILEGLEDPVAVNRGLYYSSDSGQSWTYATILDGSNQISPDSATSVVYDAAANGGTGLFVAAIRFHGFYTSSDSIHWTRLLNQPGFGLTTTNCPTIEVSPSQCPIYRGEIAVVPGRDELYAWYVDSSSDDQGIWLTTSDGTTWSQLDETGITDCGDLFGGCGTDQGTFNLALTAVPNCAPNDPNCGVTDLYAGAVNIFKCELSPEFRTCSPNGSPPPIATWLNLTHVYGCPPDFGSTAHVHPNQHAFAFQVVNQDTQDLMYFGNDGGIYRALNGYSGLVNGACGGTTNSFDSLNQTIGSLTQFVSISLSPTEPNTILGGAQANGSPATASAEGSTGWLNVNSSDGGYNQINPSDPTEWFTENTGVTIQKCELGINCLAEDFNADFIVSNATVGGDIGPLYTPFILDPQNSAELLVGTCRIWQGTTNGANFQALSNDFDTGTPATCTGNEINQVRLIAAGGPKDSNGFSQVLYAGTSGEGPLSPTSPPGGNVWVTTNAANGPGSWVNVTGGINPANYPISGIALDTTDPSGQTAYVTIVGYNNLIGQPVSRVWKTTNAGTTWQDYTYFLNNIAGAVNDVLVDGPSETVYVATDTGVFSNSTQGTGNWTELDPSGGTSGFLPNVAVTALRLFNVSGEKLLRAATYGRGVWEYAVIPAFDIGPTTANPDTVFDPSPDGTEPGSFGVVIKAQTGYAGTVDLSCAPSASCSVSKSSVMLTQNMPSATATVTANGGIPGIYTYTLTGTDPVSHFSTQVLLTLDVVNFSLSQPSPSSLTMGASGTATAGFQLSDAGPFVGLVALSCNAPPSSGISCGLSPSSVPLQSGSGPAPILANVTTSASAPLGVSTLTITGTDAGLANAVQTQTLSVTVAPSFSVTTNSDNATAPANTTATISGNVTAVNGYNSPVTLSCGSGAPPICSFTSGNCLNSVTCILTPTQTGTPFVLTLGSSIVSDYLFNLVAKSNTASLNLPLTFSATNPNAGPDFSISVSNPLLSEVVGVAGIFHGTLTALDGYADPVTLSCGPGSPPSCTPLPATVTPTSSGADFTVSANSQTSGNFAFNIVAQGGGGKTHTAAVIFDASSLTLTNDSGTQTVSPGGTTTFNLNVAVGTGGLPGPITLAYTCLPTGSSCKVAPAQIPAAGGAVTLTVVAPATSASGSYDLLVSAISGAVTAYAQPAVDLTVVGGGQGTAPFVINTGEPDDQTVIAGQTANYNFTVSNGSGVFPSNVVFTCSGLPAESSCAFTPTQTSAATSLLLSITTTAQVLSRDRGPGVSYGLWWGFAAAMILIPTRGRRKKSLSGVSLVLCVCLSLMTVMIACGGGTSAVNGQPGTPAGNYTITITGSAGASSENATPSITLSVQ